MAIEPQMTRATGHGRPDCPVRGQWLEGGSRGTHAFATWNVHQYVEADMKALRATAALLAGVALTLAVPVQAQGSNGTSSRSSSAMHSADFLPAANSGQVTIWRGTGSYTPHPRARRERDGSHDRRGYRLGRAGTRHGWWGGVYLPGGGGYFHDSIGFGPDRGYFSQSGERPLTSNGQAHFDYDRGYPYEYYYEEAREDRDRNAARAEPSCEMDWTRDLTDGDLVPVRVCRN